MMKAIIMAGGEGTRLRPVSANCPKPMVRLFDKPVLEHILKLLEKNGVREGCLTLRFLPRVVTDYFGGGEDFGMSLQHRIEEAPLGTAGGVKACGDFIGADDFLVISGDAVCDFDLQRAMLFHREKNAQVTILLYAHPNPLEYGLVMTGKDGRIEGFVEKPAWNRVFTNLINTGIYIISPEILAEIPEGEPYDFGKDLFPRLLAQNKRMYGLPCEGYWCDIGSCEAYLESAGDALFGKLAIDMGPASPRQGIWTAAPLPDGAYFAPPCYIGRDVKIGKGARIGPGAVIGAGSVIGERASVEHSVVDGANIGDDAALSGSVVCQNAFVKRDAVLEEGSVVGEGTVVGEGSLVAQKARIWPGRDIPAGSRVTENLVSGMLKNGLRFGGGGVIAGDIGVDITPEACLAIGAAAGGFGRIGVGFSGENAARLGALAVICGICSAGSEALELEGGFGAMTSFETDLYGLDGGISLKQRENRMEISFFDEYGCRPTREKERKIEAAIAGGEFSRADFAGTGGIQRVSGSVEAYVSAAAGQSGYSRTEPITVSVTGAGAENRALKRTLEKMGCRVETRLHRDMPAFEVSRDGFMLRATDEEGEDIDPQRLVAALAMVEFEDGCGAVAVPYKAPYTLDILAESYGAKVLRLGKDQGAQELYHRQPHLRDGVFGAARIVGAMAARDGTLRSLVGRVPKFSVARREANVRGDKAAVMRALSESYAGFSSEFIEGFRVNVGKGWVHVTPSATRPVLKIAGESFREEIAEELCDEFLRRAREADGRVGGGAKRRSTGD